MDQLELKTQLQQALEASVKVGGKDTQVASNALKSSHFCIKVALSLPSLLTVGGRAKLFHISFEEKSLKRKAGEWLLDAVLAEQDESGFIYRIHVALECESSTSLNAFAWDFSKLLNIRADNKIYLQGLDQLTEKGADAFVSNRLQIASRLVNESDAAVNWYFGFWPSPLRKGGYRSLWDGFAEGRYSHLQNVRLYVFDGISFVPVG